MTNIKPLRKARVIWTKWTTWEYLPWWIASIPVLFFYLWFALRSRSVLFFSNVNPDIPLGGLWGESKSDILQLIPRRLVPQSVLLPAEWPADQKIARIAESLRYPIILKPDVGERGFLIRKIHNETEALQHLEKYRIRFIAQEFVGLPVEATVLFHHFPDGRFGITSLCLKEFLSVQGDGRHSVGELMAADVRAALQLERFRKEHPALLDSIPPPGQTLLLEPIGNHARGTTFLNANPLIDPTLIQSMHNICQQMPGIRYGRFDVKCAGLDALKQGDFKVMELNGIMSDPAHIYDPAYGPWRAYRDIYRHWNIIYRLHRAQKRSGHLPTRLKPGIRFLAQYFTYKKQIRLMETR